MYADYKSASLKTEESRVEAFDNRGGTFLRLFGGVRGEVGVRHSPLGRHPCQRALAVGPFDNWPWNNWSTKGNINPHTGEPGTKTKPKPTANDWWWQPEMYSPAPPAEVNPENGAIPCRKL